MLQILRILDSCIVVPKIHHEKVIFYDRVAQLAVLHGEVDFAKEYFIKAYEASCLSCGKNSSLSLKLKFLMQNTPNNVEELQKYYF